MNQSTPLENLSVHPLLNSLPWPGETETQAMAASIAEIGLLEPLKVCKNRIVDGRTRFRGASLLGLTEIATVEVAEEEVSGVVIHSLVARGHFSKSALAYMAFPFFELELQNSRARRVHKIQKGNNSTVSAQNALTGKTGEELADRIGVSRRLFTQAAEVHRLFKKNAQHKAFFEPQVLAGEINLGYVISGIAGMEATKGKQRQDRSQLELFTDGIQSLKKRFERWNKLDPKWRNFVANEMAVSVREWPEEVREAIAKALMQEEAE